MVVRGDFTLSASLPRKAFVFVCYSHDDEAIVHPHVEWLQASGVELWYDRGIHAGTIWRNEIGEALERATHVLYFVSRASRASEHCDREVQYALDHHTLVIPVYLEDVELTPGLSVALGRVHALYAKRLGVDALRHAMATAVGTAAVAGPTIQKKSQRSAWTALVIVLGVVAVVSIGWWSMKREPDRPADTKPRVAVLPFKNLSADSNTAFFAAGLREEIVTRLGDSRELDVTSIADEEQLGSVDFALTGSVQLSQERARVSAQLVRVSDRSTTWSETYERPRSDLMDLQRQVAFQVARFLDVIVLDSVLKSEGGTTSEEAVPETTKGIVEMMNYNPLGSREALGHFDRALQLAPDHEEALQFKALTYYLLVVQGALAEREAVALMKPLVKRVVAVNESSAWGNVLAAWLSAHDGDFTAAESFLRRATSTGGAQATGYFAMCGRFEEALALHHEFPRVDLGNSLDVAGILLHSRRFGEALALVDRDVEADPENGLARGIRIETLSAMGRTREQVDAMADSEFKRALQQAYRENGDRGVAEETIKEAARQDRGETSGLAVQSWMLYVIGYAALGNVEEALRWWEEGNRRGERWIVLLTRNAMRQGFDAIRADPRYAELMIRINAHAPECPAMGIEQPVTTTAPAS